MNVSDSNDCHAIEEQHAVEVIGLVLDHARRQAACAVELDRAARAIERLARGPRSARGTRPRMSGNAEAAFPAAVDVGSPTSVDSGIDQRDERHVAVVVELIGGDVGVARTPATNNRSAFVHLRRGQADAGVLAHGLEHVVDEPLNRAGDAISAGGTGCAFARSTGWPIRATFRIGHWRAYAQMRQASSASALLTP